MDCKIAGRMREAKSLEGFEEVKTSLWTLVNLAGVISWSFELY